MRIEPVIKHYQLKYMPHHLAEIKWFSELPTLAAAVAKAAIAQDYRGKRYSHQRRIPLKAIIIASQKLALRIQDIERCTSFDNLLGLITSILSEVTGIGELYCYDTSLRIGARLSLKPEFIYLHAGTRIGASFFIKTKGRKHISREKLPCALQPLEPDQIEDILCIYKGRFDRLPNQEMQPTGCSNG